MQSWLQPLEPQQIQPSHKSSPRYTTLPRSPKTMPFAFLIVGTVLVISGVKGTSQQLLTLVKGDLQGKNGYLYWIVSILLIGSLGYIPAFKNFSRAFLVLVL